MKKMEYPYEVSAGKTLYKLQVITNNLTSKDLSSSILMEPLVTII